MEDRGKKSMWVCVETRDGIKRMLVPTGGGYRVEGGTISFLGDDEGKDVVLPLSRLVYAVSNKYHIDPSIGPFISNEEVENRVVAAEINAHYALELTSMLVKFVALAVAGYVAWSLLEMLMK
ncbi:MAG: hypothetical protein FD177_1028 [Desulfovibrionaceae bacterium]|nr:MAG: hypothetical protein FD177_1028 [Desulfovibrionaceae bacterium]